MPVEKPVGRHFKDSVYEQFARIGKAVAIRNALRLSKLKVIEAVEKGPLQYRMRNAPVAEKIPVEPS